jgi:hypothetical protein
VHYLSRLESARPAMAKSPLDWCFWHRLSTGLSAIGHPATSRSIVGVRDAGDFMALPPGWPSGYLYITARRALRRVQGIFSPALTLAQVPCTKPHLAERKGGIRSSAGPRQALGLCPIDDAQIQGSLPSKEGASPHKSSVRTGTFVLQSDAWDNS